ncbi:MAG: hypothetical protein H7X94_11540 [Vallitaleaceae bacterium]|nr:hypothetical protein [Vallitaleaceae bacterium]
MKKLQDYVDHLFASIPDSEQKENARQDILQTLEEKVMDLMNEGKAEEDAINKALVEFGDFQEVKNELMEKQAPGKKNYGIALGYSVWGSILIIALVVFINMYYTPKEIWFIYPTFCVLWWPLSMFFRWLSHR